MTKAQINDRADEWAEDGEEILVNDEEFDSEVFAEIEEYFKDFERNEEKEENREQFEKIEPFIQEEKNSGRKLRETVRLLAQGDEVHLAAEVAELKFCRLKQKNRYGDQRLHERIVDAERTYGKRKLIISKAARIANSDCRKQFKRVRDLRRPQRQAPSTIWQIGQNPIHVAPHA